MKGLLLLSFTVVGMLLNQKSCGKNSDWFFPLQSQDLSNFVQVNGQANYVVEKEVLVGTSVIDSPNSFLALKDSYGDFILEFDVKIDMGLNSGVQIRSTYDPNIMDGRVHGYQVEIETSDRKWAGGIYEEAGRGWLYSLPDNIKGQNAWNNNQWNHYRIEANGMTIRTWVNGVPCAHLTDKKSSSGIIAFQVHSIEDQQLNGKQVMWKNIKVLSNNIADHLTPESNNIHQMDLTKM